MWAFWNMLMIFFVFSISGSFFFYIENPVSYVFFPLLVCFVGFNISLKHCVKFANSLLECLWCLWYYFLILIVLDFIKTFFFSNLLYFYSSFTMCVTTMKLDHKLVFITSMGGTTVSILRKMAQIKIITTCSITVECGTQRLLNIYSINMFNVFLFYN